MKVRTLLGMTENPIRPQNCSEFCLPKCRIGLEYEWENAVKFPLTSKNPAANNIYKELNDQVFKYFETKPDNSLRNNGVEFVLKEPMHGNALLEAVRAMGELARIGGYTASHRTSLHVHMDMQDVEYPRAAIAVACAYCLAEPFMYKFVGRGRANSNYCVPWYETPQHYQIFLRCVRGADKESKENLRGRLLHSQQYKYSGLNVFSLGKLGTFEFRQAGVEMQVDKVITWINLIMSLKKFAIEHATWSPDYLYTRASRMGVRETLVTLFGEYASNPLVFTKSPEADFIVGLNTLAHFISVLEEGE